MVKLIEDINIYKVKSAKMSQFIWIFQENRMHENQKITDKVSKHNGCTLFSTIVSSVSIGGVKFVFYLLSYLNFTSSLFVQTHL